MAADDPRSGSQDWRPVPDPTTLTTEQLRRELSALREVLVTRIEGMDRATDLLSETVNRTPTVIQTEISHLRELMNEKLGSLSSQADEKFTSVDQRFNERDVRTDQAAKASKEALDAALLAAKELVSQQNEANAAAADKAEQSTIKQIDQIGIRIDTMQKALDDRLTELKERIDRGEGGSTAASAQRTETRLNTGQIIAAVGAMLAAAAIIVTIILATGH
jgi:sugar-specific transcriptional regulator TrmB